MVKCLQLILFIPLFFSLTSQAQFTSVSYSIQAHQDDWQLFMGSKIMADLNVSGRKVVFITLTAGFIPVTLQRWMKTVSFILPAEKKKS